MLGHDGLFEDELPIHRAPDGVDSAGEDKAGLQERILNTARDQYMKLGFSRVTMDETASALGISKKTLYLHYGSKEDLVRAVCESHQAKIEAALKAIHQDAQLSPLEKLKQQTSYVAKVYSELSPSLIHDLQRSQPEIWKSIQDNRQRCLETDFLGLIVEGQQNHTFRSDIDANLFLKIYGTVIEGILHPSVLAELPYPPNEVYESLARILFEGFLTDSARTDYHEKK